MKILHISKFPCPPYGGVEQYVENLCEYGNNKNSNYKYELIFSSNKRKFDKKFNSYSAYTFGKIFSAQISPQLPIKIRNIIKQQKIDIFHGHSPNPWSDLSIILNKNSPSVLTWHSDIVKQKQIYFFYKHIEKSSLKIVKKIIVPSQSHFISSNVLSKHKWIEEKIEIIPLSIDVKKLIEPIQSNIEIDQINSLIGNEQFCLSVGRHVYYKGYEYLIEAFSKIQDKKIKLILVGHGILTNKLRLLISKNKLNNRVKIIPEISLNSLKYLYKNCSFFLLPSIEKSEAFGLASAEAMVFSKPTIVCDLNNGVNELNIKNHTSLFVKPRDVDDLTNAIDSFVKDDLLIKEFGQNAKKHVLKNYSFESSIKKLNSVYEEILK